MPININPTPVPAEQRKHLQPAKREVRVITGARIRAKSDDGKGATGYAAVFNEVAELGWLCQSIIGALACAPSNLY